MRRFTANGARRKSIRVGAITTSSESMPSPTLSHPSSRRKISTRMSVPRLSG